MKTINTPTKRRVAGLLLIAFNFFLAYALDNFEFLENVSFWLSFQIPLMLGSLLVILPSMIGIGFLMWDSRFAQERFNLEKE